MKISTLGFVAGLKSISDMYMALGAEVEGGFVNGWERQIGDKSDGKA